MKLSEQIRAASRRLTPENWFKGNLFGKKSGILCMCAHGAMQVECNPSFKRAIDPWRVFTTADGFAQSWHGARAGDLATHLTRAGSEAKAWENCPDWIRDIHPKYGNLEAHFLLGMVGLTVGFNDHPDTTLEQVLEKFEQAAKLAECLGV